MDNPILNISNIEILKTKMQERIKNIIFIIFSCMLASVLFYGLEMFFNGCYKYNTLLSNIFIVRTLFLTVVVTNSNKIIKKIDFSKIFLILFFCVSFDFIIHKVANKSFLLCISAFFTNIYLPIMFFKLIYLLKFDKFIDDIIKNINPYIKYIINFLVLSFLLYIISFIFLVISFDFKCKNDILVAIIIYLSPIRIVFTYIYAQYLKKIKNKFYIECIIPKIPFIFLCFLIFDAIISIVILLLNGLGDAFGYVLYYSIFYPLIPIYLINRKSDN